MKLLIGVGNELLRYGLIQLLKDVQTVDSMVMVDTASELVDSLKQYTFDLIVIDERLPYAAGLRSVVALMQYQPESCKKVMMYLYQSNELEEMIRLNQLHMNKHH